MGIRKKTLTTMRVLPLQINQGILRHPNIIRIMKKHYMYDIGGMYVYMNRTYKVTNDHKMYTRTLYT